MRITICLSDRVTKDLVESAIAFNQSIDEILLRGPGFIGGMLQAAARTGGYVAVRQRRPGGMFLVTQLNVPTLENFRRKPGVWCFDGSSGDLGGRPLEGTTVALSFEDAALEEIRTVLRADSLLEAYSYSLWLYLMLLRTTRDIPGAEVGVHAPKEGRFYCCEE